MTVAGYTPPQLAALAHPCRLAAMTARSALRHQISPAVSLVLSINTGYE